jgi:ketosteroid isomerase-like protein
MSANLDLVRSIYAAWERGDWSSADWAHPEIELVATEGPTAGSWTGVPAMAKAWRETLSAFTDFRAEAEEYRELEEGRVLVLHNWSGRGRASALAVEQMGANSATVFHIREGRVTRLVTYWNRDRALADLGLKE